MGSSSGRGHKPAVLVRVVGAYHEAVALMVHPIFVSRPTWGYQDGLRSGIGCGYKPLLRSNVVTRADHDVLLRRGERQTDEETGVGFGVDYGVAFSRFAEYMQARLVRAPVLVQHDVEEAGVVRSPHDASGGVLDSVFRQIASGQILDCYRVSLGAVGIGAVGEHIAVVAHRHRSKLEVLGAFRQRRLIQNRLRVGGRSLPRVRVGGGPTLPDAILASFFVTPLVVPFATFPGHA